MIDRPARRARAADALAAVVHREIVQLAALIVIAIAAFFVTRALAASNHATSVRDAAQWYQRGQHQLAAGDAGRAVDSFRRAALKNRRDTRYGLALAAALARTHQDDAARRVLLGLRDAAPEDPGINLQLARLAADRQDVTEATRYYHNALFAPWPADQDETRRTIRIELVRFLLSHGQVNRAISELVAVTADLPDDAATHVRVAQLFSTAGDQVRALDQFQRALRLDADNGPALAGAGLAAFQLGDYPAARTFLRSAPAGIPGVAETRDVVALVLSADPLASRIGVTARRQRLASNLDAAGKRLGGCLAGSSNSQEHATAEAELAEAQALVSQLRRLKTLEADTIEAGVDLGSRMAQSAGRACPPATPADRALILIARLHGVDQR